MIGANPANIEPGDDLLSRSSADAGRVRRAAFAWLRAGSAVSADRLAWTPDFGQSRFWPRSTSWSRRVPRTLDQERLVVAAGGLSVVRTAHQLRLDEVEAWTWCAFDAVGIPAALGIDDLARTHCGHCGAAIELSLAGGIPPADSPVVGWLPDQKGVNVQRDFCPHANLFCTRQTPGPVAGIGRRALRPPSQPGRPGGAGRSGVGRDESHAWPNRQHGDSGRATPCRQHAPP